MARRIAVDTTVRSPAFLRSVARAASAVLRLVERTYVAALEEPSSVRHGPTRNLQIRHQDARLRPAAVRELNRRIDAFYEFLVERDDPEGSSCSLTVALTPGKTGD